MKRVIRVEDDGDEDMIAFVARNGAAVPMAEPVQRGNYRQAPRVSDMDEIQIEKDVKKSKTDWPKDKWTWKVQVIERPQGKVVPRQVQDAAALLLGVPELAPAIHAELARLTGQWDENTAEDPPVLLETFVDTGSLRVHLGEVVPISSYLMARYLGCVFSIPLTKTSSASNADWNYDMVKPVPLILSADEVERLQPLGCQAAVDRRLDDSVRLQVRAYMHSLGPLTSAEVCDPYWIEEQLTVFQNIFVGRFVVVVPYVPKKTTLAEELD